MRRPGWFCLTFVLLATVSAIAVPAAKSGAAETALGGSQAEPREQPARLRRSAGIQAGPSIEEPERDRQAAVAEPGTKVTDENGPDHAGPGEFEGTGTGPLNTVQPESEPAETEPLAPIETQSSIRVNANVSLPQDI